MRRRTLVLAALGATAAVVGGGVVLRGAGPVATGYAAQIGCGVVLLQERPVDQVVPELPDNPLVPLLRVRERDGAVEASLLGGFTSRAAPAGDGGCRLLEDGAEVPTVAVAAMVPTADDLVVPTSPANEAANAGFDTTVLDTTLTRAFAEDADPETEVNTRAVVVVHRGTVVAERYADGFDADTPLLGWSMTKTVANAMAGRLVAEDLLDVDQPVPGGIWDADDPRAAITIDQLLTMTDGLAFEEVYDVGTDATRMLFTPGDTGAFAADQPLVADPGTRWSYSSGTSNVLCDALVRVAGGEPTLVARRLVFEPLAMTSATLGDDGDAPVCSSFAYATARDWARFGLLYAQDGVWGGQQLLPAGWVAATTAPVAVPTVDEDGAVTPYGRHVWLNADAQGQRRLPDVPADAFWASGNEGQQVVVLPSHGIVVVRLGLTRGTSSTGWGLEPLLAGIIEAAEGAA